MIAPLLLYCVSLVLGVPGLALEALRSDSDGGGPWILASVVAGVLGYLLESRRESGHRDELAELRREVHEYRCENVAYAQRLELLAMQVAEMRAGGE